MCLKRCDFSLVSIISKMHSEAKRLPSQYNQNMRGFQEEMCKMTHQTSQRCHKRTEQEAVGLIFDECEHQGALLSGGTMSPQGAFTRL